jgi:hypothetical protein
MPTLPEHNSIQYLIRPSGGQLCSKPLVPYHPLACEFLAELSARILADGDARRFPDVVSFAYWCRKANIEKLRREHGEQQIRLGLGLAFHIAPSNVPVNFAFSYVFSLLAGNANIVRVPSKPFEQIGIICRAISALFALDKYQEIAEMTAFVGYPQDDAVTAAFSALCHARIIWGGDQTISHIRRIPASARCVEVAFSDRYSFCVIDAASVQAAQPAQIEALAQGFYNDIFLMDQNACSSPHLLVWLGAADTIARAKGKFWECVAAVTQARLDLQPVNAVDKFTLLCRNAIDSTHVAGVQRHGNFLYRVKLEALPEKMEEFRGKHGLVYEFDTATLDSVAGIVNPKYQTMTYFGLDKTVATEFVVKNRLSGIDRVVPVGTALDIGIVWDGYDLVRSLSRIVDFR